jgi:uncharacterized protein YdaU (DUF1376 family)
MNYYERHIGDYLKDTAHLSLLEHGVYTRLLDVYYIREQGIPDDQAARLIGARSKEEREALGAVLQEFFTQRDGIWIQKRCDEEIARLADKRRKASASANARWSHTGRNANASTDAKRTQSEGNALQSPDSNHQGEEGKPPPRKRGKKHPIPDDFGLTPERSAYAERYLPQVDPDALMATFRGMAESKAWEYADWNAHWQTLVRQWAPNSGHWSSGQYPKLAINGGQHAGVVMR